MQKGIRINESQLLYLASKARVESTLNGHLYKKSADTGKWQLRWFALYQNLLFYYENDTCPKPSGIALLEGCYCERVIMPGSGKAKEGDKLVRSSDVSAFACLIRTLSRDVAGTDFGGWISRAGYRGFGF